MTTFSLLTKEKMLPSIKLKTRDSINSYSAYIILYSFATEGDGTN